MADSPWALIVDGSGNVTERRLGDHRPGQLLKPSVAVEEVKVVGDLRSVTVTRPLKGASPDYYTFTPFTEAWRDMLKQQRSKSFLSKAPKLELKKLGSNTSYVSPKIFGQQLSTKGRERPAEFHQRRGQHCELVIPQSLGLCISPVATFFVLLVKTEVRGSLFVSLYPGTYYRGRKND